MYFFFFFTLSTCLMIRLWLLQDLYKVPGRLRHTRCLQMLNLMTVSHTDTAITCLVRPTWRQDVDRQASHMQGDSRRNSDTSLEVQEVGCQHLATWHRDVIPWQGSIVHQRHPYVNITKLRNVLTNKPVFVRNRAY